MLPIEKHRGEIVSAFAENQCLVLKAPPGSGKTTGVPPMLLDAPERKNPGGQIWLIQPRRLAARTAAARIASNLDSQLGRRVGYHVRGDRKCDSNTRIIAMTTGVALARMQSDPFLENVDAVLIDEFHERSLDMDLLLAMSIELRRTLRDDLRIGVMSATVDPQPIADHITATTGGETTIVVSQGRMFPVTIEYGSSIDWRSFDRVKQLARATTSVFAQTDGDGGDVLVFLPGVAEIRGVAGELANLDADVRRLYGSMSPRDQDDALLPSDRRRIFLATNIAETSLTIDGVTTVIDSGKAKSMVFNSKVGLPSLELIDTSIASSDQRAGRAGRTRPGQAIRLWPSDRQRFRRPDDAPEILRGDLTSAILRLIQWGESDVLALPWLTPPSDSSVRHGFELLDRLGATKPADRSGAAAAIGVTDKGAEMVAMPVHPRIAAFIIEAKQYRIAPLAAVIATMLSVDDPTRSGAAKSELSLFGRLEMIIAGQCDRSRIGAFRREVTRLCKRIGLEDFDWSPGNVEIDRRAVAKCLLAGFVDRLCRRRADDPRRGVLASGRGVRWRDEIGDQELLIALQIDDASREAWLQLAVPVERTWIDDSLLRTSKHYHWDSENHRVIARASRAVAGLELQQWPEKVTACDEVASILVQQAVQNVWDMVPKGGDADGLLTRWRWLGQVGGLEIDGQSIPPPPDRDKMIRWITDFARTATSLTMIRQSAWYDTLAAELGYQNIRRLDTLAPVQLKVPGGRSVRVVYPEQSGEDDRDFDRDIRRDARPRIEAKIGELFGWRQTPLIAGGRVKLQIHLLSPAGRVEQITDDLHHFWTNTYTMVRKDLRGRYPKHHWPEDPTTAEATRNGLKPR